MSEPAKDEKPKDDGPQCEDCGTTKDVEEGPCPYASELYDDETPRWLCSECRYQRAMDV